MNNNKEEKLLAIIGDVDPDLIMEAARPPYRAEARWIRPLAGAAACFAVCIGILLLTRILPRFERVPPVDSTGPSDSADTTDVNGPIDFPGDPVKLAASGDWYAWEALSGELYAYFLNFTEDGGMELKIDPVTVGYLDGEWLENYSGRAQRLTDEGDGIPVPSYRAELKEERGASLTLQFTAGFKPSHRSAVDESEFTLTLTDAPERFSHLIGQTLTFMHADVLVDSVETKTVASLMAFARFYEEAVKALEDQHEKLERLLHQLEDGPNAEGYRVLIADTEEDLACMRAELARIEEEIRRLDQEKKVKETQLADLNAQMAQIQQQIEDHLAASKIPEEDDAAHGRAVAALREQLAALEGRAAAIGRELYGTE